MRLISLTANQKSFHPIIFKDGINIIAGKQVTPHNENDGNTYNGVGKSLTLHLIHFCLGSRKIESFAKVIPEWEFTLRFQIDDKEHYCMRSTCNQNKIEFNGEILKPKEVQERLRELCFGLKETPKDMTWTTLFSRFVRKSRLCYSIYDAFVPKESDYSKILNNCFLLGIDKELIVAKRELRDRQVAAAATEKAIKNDPLFRQYYLGKNDAELDVADLEYRIAELAKEISVFKVSKNYHELEKEADEKSYQKKELENKIATFTGGRAAEEIVFGEITTGASNDIEQATKIARAMITRYGMTDEFDMVAMETVSNQYLGGDASLSCSADTQKEIDEKVVELVKREHEKAKKILTDNRKKLDELAMFLYEKETITGEEFMKILNNKEESEEK